MLKKSPYEISKARQIRVIIDTDCACEADDQFAVVHALITPKMDVRAVCAEHFCGKLSPRTAAETEAESYNEIKKLARLMELDEVNILHGCTETLPDDKTFVDSEASRFIIEEALREDDRPLFVLCQGALTNLASAILQNPDIADKLVAISIGGGTYPDGGYETNWCNDLVATNVVLDSSVELWQVPMNAYYSMHVNLSELYQKVHCCGEIGAYLTENVFENSREMFAQDAGSVDLSDLYTGGAKLSRGAAAVGGPSGESWNLGDQPCVGLLIRDHSAFFDVIGAPQIKDGVGDDFHSYIMSIGKYALRPDNPRKIRVYNFIDREFIMSDFYAKLSYQFGDEK